MKKNSEKNQLLPNLRRLLTSQFPDLLTPALKDKGWCLGIGRAIIDELHQKGSADELLAELKVIEESADVIQDIKPQWVELAESMGKIQAQGNRGVGTIIAVGFFSHISAFVEMLEKWILPGQALCFANHLTGTHEGDSHAIFVYRDKDQFYLIDGSNDRILKKESCQSVAILIQGLSLKFPSMGVISIQCVKPYTPIPNLTKDQWKDFYNNYLTVLNSSILRDVVYRVQEWGKDFISAAVMEYYSEYKVDDPKLNNIDGIFHQFGQYPWLLNEVFRRNLNGQNLSQVDFNSADLKACLCVKSNLKEAHFNNAQLAGADFEDAEIDNRTCFVGSKIEGAKFGLRPPGDIIWSKLALADRSPIADIAALHKKICRYLALTGTPALFFKRIRRLFDIPDPRAALAAIQWIGVFQHLGYGALCDLILKKPGDSICLTRHYQNPSNEGHMDFAVISFEESKTYKIFLSECTLTLNSIKDVLQAIIDNLSLLNLGVISIQWRVDKSVEKSEWIDFIKRYNLVKKSIKLDEVPVLLPTLEGSNLSIYPCIRNPWQKDEKVKTIYNGDEKELKNELTCPWLANFYYYENLSSSSFRGRDISKIDLEGAQLYGVDFTNAFLTEMDLTNSKLDEKTNFRGAILNKVKINHSPTPGSLIYSLLGVATLSCDSVYNEILHFLCSDLSNRTSDSHGVKRKIRLFQLLIDGGADSIKIVKDFLRTGYLNGIDPEKKTILSHNPSRLLRQSIIKMMPVKYHLLSLN